MTDENLIVILEALEAAAAGVKTAESYIARDFYLRGLVPANIATTTDILADKRRILAEVER
jgi:hypothetical protein